MKQWIISRADGSVSVTADRVFYDNGRITFFNNKSEGSRYGDTVAVFAPGEWLYVKSAGAETCGS